MTAVCKHSAHCPVLSREILYCSHNISYEHYNYSINIRLFNDTRKEKIECNNVTAFTGSRKKENTGGFRRRSARNCPFFYSRDAGIVHKRLKGEVCHDA